MLLLPRLDIDIEPTYCPFPQPDRLRKPTSSNSLVYGASAQAGGMEYLGESKDSVKHEVPLVLPPLTAVAHTKP